MFAIIVGLGSSLNVRDHVSQPYRATDNIIVLHTLIFKFLERSLEDKMFVYKHVFGLNNNMNLLL